tara:strand:+ start:2814 stop:3731 length:918 start_codon:yes stop_codon:yes gene_type:complete
LSDKAQILKKALGPHWVSGEELLFQCPKCTHDKLKMSVNIDKNAFKCWVCDFSGNKISYLISKFAPEYYSEWSNVADEVDLSQYEFIFEEPDEAPDIAISLPEEFKTLTGEKGKEKKKALEYLYSRGITDIDILKWKIGFCDYGEYEGRIIVPSFNLHGRVNYFVSRTYREDWMKYKNPKVSKNIIFNDLNIDWEADIVIVEGVFDAIRHKNAIPLLGSTLREEHKLFQKICRNKSEIYLALDDDAKDKELVISKRFKEYGILSKTIKISPYTDAAEIPKIEFLDRKINAELIAEIDYLRYKLNF